MGDVNTLINYFRSQGFLANLQGDEIVVEIPPEQIKMIIEANFQPQIKQIAKVEVHGRIAIHIKLNLLSNLMFGMGGRQTWR